MAQAFNDHVINTTDKETEWYKYTDMIRSGKLSRTAVQEYELWEKTFIANDKSTPKKDRRYILDQYFEEAYGTKRWIGTTCISQFSHLNTYFTQMLQFDIKVHCSLLYKKLDRWKDPDSVDHANTFTSEQMDEYISMTDPSYLSHKVVFILGYFGTLRISEIMRIKYNDVVKFTHTDGRNGYMVETVLSKSRSDHPPKKKYVILDPRPVATLNHYLNLTQEFRKKQQEAGIEVSVNLMYKVYADGSIKDLMGEKYYTDIPRDIAIVLNLDDPKGYRGHSFRRSAATNAAENGATTREIMKMGEWKSEAVALKYVDDSVRSMVDRHDKQKPPVKVNIMQSSSSSTNQDTTNRHMIGTKQNDSSTSGGQTLIFNFQGAHLGNNAVFDLSHLAGPKGNVLQDLLSQSDSACSRSPVKKRQRIDAIEIEDLENGILTQHSEAGRNSLGDVFNYSQDFASPYHYEYSDEEQEDRFLSQGNKDVEISVDGPNDGQQVHVSDVVAIPASIDAPAKNTRFRGNRKL